MTDDQMFSSRTDMELLGAHARLSRKARQLGMKSGQAPSDRRRLIAAVEALHASVSGALAAGAVPVRAEPMRSELSEQYERLRAEAVRRAVYVGDMPPAGHAEPRLEHCAELRRRLGALPVNEQPLKEMTEAELHAERCELMVKAASRGVHTADLKSTGLLSDKRRGAMTRCCEILRARLRRPVASSEATTNVSPGMRRLRASPSAESVRQQTLLDQEHGRREALARIQREGEKTMNDTTTAATETVAAAPKKAPAKKPAKAKAKAGGAGGAAKLADDKRIVVKTKENPRREGTGQYKRYETILKYSGKTVAEYLKGKGDRTALTRAHDEGHIGVK